MTVGSEHAIPSVGAHKGNSWLSEEVREVERQKKAGECRGNSMDPERIQNTCVPERLVFTWVNSICVKRKKMMVMFS